MAIIPGVPGLDVEIRVDDVPLVEYVDEDMEDDVNTVTRYIRATSGEKFTVHWTFQENFEYRDWDINTRLYVDGKRVDGCVNRSDKRKGQTTFNGAITSVRSFEKKKFIKRDLLFSEVKVDEDSTHASTSELKDAFGSLGEIRIHCWHGKALKSHPPSSMSSPIAVGMIPKQAIKGRAVSHQLKLGDATSGTKYHTSPFKKKTKKPFAVFKFPYRSTEALKAERIIPRSPTPTLLEDRPLEDLTAEELREIVRRQRMERSAAQEAMKKEVKQEIKQEGSLSGAGVVSLGGGDSDFEITDVRPRKRQRMTRPGEVIDLCDD